jgi:hypothetical protein
MPELIQVLADLVAAAIKAWSTASGIPPTPENILKLLPDETPLDPPTS